MAAGIGVIRVPSPVSHVEISTATGEGGTGEGLAGDTMVPQSQVGTSVSISPCVASGTVPSGPSAAPPATLTSRSGPPSLSNLRLMCIVQNGCPPRVSPRES